ncbi:MAG TPA: Hsp20/alpha crystallin family protein [Firmicutes bacterium]|nr:Hsp20/alpha crystallin family protein [Bacillota bacterium]
MSLTPWRPLRELSREMWEFLERGPFPYLGEGRVPKVDIYQTESEVIVSAEVPGVSKEDLQLYVDESSVRISGQMEQNKEFRDEHIYRTERQFGSFARTVSLPAEVKPDEARAEYKDGILSVRIPKKNPGKANGRRVYIQ